jgi:hypothetical protein
VNDTDNGSPVAIRLAYLARNTGPNADRVWRVDHEKHYNVVDIATAKLEARRVQDENAKRPTPGKEFKVKIYMVPGVWVSPLSASAYERDLAAHGHASF